MNKRRSSIVAVFALTASMLTMVTGCGAASDAVSTVEETRSHTLHGKWYTSSGEERPAAVIVEQSGLSARLIVTLEGHVCLSRSVIEAELSVSDGLKTTADVAGMRLVIEGSPGLDDLIGNFETIKEGPCPGQGGWMSVTR